MDIKKQYLFTPHIKYDRDIYKIHIKELTSNILHYTNYSEYWKSHDIFLIDLPYPKLMKDLKILSYIPEEFYDKILNGSMLLGIYNGYEAAPWYRHIDYIYEYLIIEGNIPESQILFIGGSLDFKDYILYKSEELNKKPIKFEYFSECFFRPRIDINDLYDGSFNLNSPLTKLTTKKSFVLLNRTLKEHRLALLYLLNEKKLIEHGFISCIHCGPRTWELCLENTTNMFTDEITHKFNNNIAEKVPLYLDYKGDTPNAWQKAMPRTGVGWCTPKTAKTPVRFGSDINFSTMTLNIFLKKYYNQTYFSIVSETLYFSDKPRFLTEKTFNCFVFKHPFILVSCPKVLENLRYLGFKTFHPYINEDYDLEMDDNKRLLMIADEAERLCNLSELELKSFKENLLEIVEYNYNHLMNTENLVFKLL